MSTVNQDGTDYTVSAAEALSRLQAGNSIYRNTWTNPGDVSRHLREKTKKEGQHPYAVILCCSDSRTVPEHIFSAGIGELFVIRVAGNVTDRHQLGSIAYAVEHLGCRLVVVLGHTDCGAVGATIAGGETGYIGTITEEIRLAIGEEKDSLTACCKNARRSAEKIREALGGQPTTEGDAGDLAVISAVYDIADGSVVFLEL